MEICSMSRPTSDIQSTKACTTIRDRGSTTLAASPSHPWLVHWSWCSSLPADLTHFPRLSLWCLQISGLWRAWRKPGCAGMSWLWSSHLYHAVLLSYSTVYKTNFEPQNNHPNIRGHLMWQAYNLDLYIMWFRPSLMVSGEIVHKHVLWPGKTATRNWNEHILSCLW